jgi:hypothetical protein
MVYGYRLENYVTPVTILLFNVKCGGGGEIVFNFRLDGGNCLSSGITRVKYGMVMDRKGCVLSARNFEVAPEKCNVYRIFMYQVLHKNKNSSRSAEL